MAAKTKRNVSGNALLRRKQFMEGATTPTEEATKTEESTKTEEAPDAKEDTADPQHADTPDTAPAQPASDPEREESTSPPPADEEQEQQATGVSKKHLLDRYLAVKHDGLEADTIYFPSELYDVFRDVWFARKKTKRGFKKSHIIIEALLRHPDILEELKRQELLK